MSLDEKRWFEEWKAKLASFGIAIDDPWTATKLEGLLYQEKNYGLKEVIFKEEYLSQVREMRSTLQQLLAEIAARLPNPTERKPFKFIREFPASIVFNDSDNLPQSCFHASPVGSRLNSKATIARPYRHVDGKCLLTVDVPVTDDMKIVHGADALQCKIVDDICNAQRGGVSRQWVAGEGVTTKFTTPTTPEPTTRIPGPEILAALSGNRFAQNTMLENVYEHSSIPFPDGTLISLDGHPGGPGVGPVRRRIFLTVTDKVALIVSIQPTISGGGLPKGVAILGELTGRCLTFTYAVRIEAEIVRAGVHDDVIHEYKAWIVWLASELESHNSDEESI